MKGLVLAGGKSTRFGTDKALADFRGTSLVERAAELLGKMKLEPVIVTREEADYSFISASVLRDRLPEKGPLGGLYTAMSAFSGKDLLALTCDMPLLDTTVLSKLLSAYRACRLTTIFRTADGRIQPFPGIYPASIYSLLKERLFRGQLSLSGLLDELACKQVVGWRGDPALFANVNRREDLERCDVLQGSF